jgi:hypothetical protein
MDNNWTYIAPLKYATYDAAMATLGDKIHIFGGWINETVDGTKCGGAIMDVYMYNSSAWVCVLYFW